MSKHKKHTKLSKPGAGLYGPLSIAIVGAPCSLIQATAISIIQALPDLKCAYLDADHVSDTGDTTAAPNAVNATTITKSGWQYKILLDGALDPLRRRAILQDRDLLLVNGNHYDAEHQILILDERKPLSRKTEKITNPLLVLRQNAGQRIPDIPGKDHLLIGLPEHNIGDVQNIAAAVRQILENYVPELYGLVLAGGLSTRMGMDKGDLRYHGKPQREHIFGLLQRYTTKTYLSCRADQAHTYSPSFPVLVDTFTGLGPFGALLSAFREYPDKAWLVSACDLPLIGTSELRDLVQQRDPYRMATAFRNAMSDFPEPLITIWEPRAYPVLLQFLSEGYSCPRKVLINSDTKLIEPKNPEALVNVNSPEEHEAILQKIRGKQD